LLENFLRWQELIVKIGNESVYFLIDHVDSPDNNNFRIIALVDSQKIGHIEVQNGQTVSDAYECTRDGINVAEQYRGRRIGSALMVLAMGISKYIFKKALFYIETSEADKFYDDNLGFEEVPQSIDEDGEDYFFDFRKKLPMLGIKKHS